MPYALRKKEAFGAGLRRIAREEARRALRESKNPSRATEERIHEVRKSCKRLRALLRLLRPQLGERAKSENHKLRDAARRLSSFRDIQVMRNLHASLAMKSLSPEEAKNEASRLFASPRPRRDPLPQLRRTLEQFHARTRSWDLKEMDWDDLATGLARSLRRVRKAMKRALRTRRNGDLHEWRKQAKRLGYHLDIFRPFLRKKGKRFRHGVKQLEECLGDDHDLAVFQVSVRKSQAISRGRRAKLLHRAGRKRNRLLQQSSSLAHGIFSHLPQSKRLMSTG